MKLKEVKIQVSLHNVPSQNILFFTLLLLSRTFIGHIYSSWNLRGLKNKIKVQKFKNENHEKKNIFTHTTISYFEAIFKANRPYQSQNNRLNRSYLCDTVKSKQRF